MAEEKSDLPAIARAHLYSSRATEALAENDYANAVMCHEKAAAHFLRAASMTSDLGSIGALRALAVDHDSRAKDIRNFTETAQTKNMNNISLQTTSSAIPDSSQWQRANRERWIGKRNIGKDEGDNPGPSHRTFERLGLSPEVQTLMKEIRVALTSVNKAHQAGLNTVNVGASMLGQSTMYDKTTAESFLVVPGSETAAGPGESSIIGTPRKLSRNVSHSLGVNVDQWEVPERIRSEVKRMQAAMAELNAENSNLARENYSLKATTDPSTAKASISAVLDMINDRVTQVFNMLTRDGRALQAGGGVDIAGGEAGGMAQQRIAQLEANMAELKSQNTQLLQANRKYQEQWDRLKANAMKRKDPSNQSQMTSSSASMGSQRPSTSS